MAQGKQTREEDIQMVRELKIQDPQLSSRDISKQTWINHTTVCEIINNIPELLTTSDKWDSIIDTMDTIISEIADMTRLSMKPIRDKLIEWTLGISDLKALNDIAKNNFDRKQILTWKPTDITKHEWLEGLSTAELLKLANGNN